MRNQTGKILCLIQEERRIMKLRKDFILREMAGEYVIIPTGKNALVQEGLLTINEAGAGLWKKLEQGAGFKELVDAVLERYDIAEEAAVKEIQEFLELLLQNDILIMEEDTYKNGDYYR